MQRKILLTGFLAICFTVLFSCGKQDDVTPEYVEYPYGNADIGGVQINGSGLITLQPDTCNRVIRQTKGAQISKLGNFLLLNAGGEIVIGCRNNLSISLNGGGVRNLDSAIFMKQLNISGQNGQVYLTKMTAESINVGVTNTGDWQIKGNTGYLTVSTSNFGRFFGFDLQADSCVVSHAGLGDVQVNVINKLTGGVYSLGNLFYKGHPPIVNVSAVGSGKAIEQ
ncbi:MAG: hypothetical protein JWM14_2093 [Chitinophagaceae bacterium]|nr:hypothetical protein [Chitinophagaceae bacterium]